PHSQFPILNSPFSIPHSQFPILNSPFSILHSQFSIPPSPPALTGRPRPPAVAGLTAHACFFKVILFLASLEKECISLF
ncbi:MAG: hypothetical protein IKQ20_14445, partial [Bacteroidales bacterium]|nr:hypothetical protein [Bacteroidales bacterium]